MERFVNQDSKKLNPDKVFTKPFMKWIGNFLTFFEKFNLIRPSCDIIDGYRLAIMVAFYKEYSCYHPIPSVSKRWQYVSNKRVMFTDLIMFDSCRYFYDILSFEDDQEPQEPQAFHFFLLVSVLDSLEKTLYYQDEKFRQYSYEEHNGEIPLQKLQYRQRIDI